MILFSFLSCCATGQDGYEEARKRMVREQIERRGVRDTATIRAMLTVPRHLFVPTYTRKSAYEDRPLSIGHGQTISQPYIVAYMTEAIDPSKCKKVLEIGTGSGYQAAVLAEIVDEVYTVEIIKELGERARKTLAELHYNNVSVKIGNGYEGWSEYAPYDAIIVTAAPEKIPPPLIEQLKDGGRMIIPVGETSYLQHLMLVEKSNGQIKTKTKLPVRFVPFTGEKNEE